MSAGERAAGVTPGAGVSGEEDAAAVFRALGDRTRLALVARLAGGAALSIAALGADAGMSRQAVAKHLRVLEDAGVVAYERVGRETRYALRGETVATARAYLAAVGAQWDAALERLRVLVEE